MQRVQVHSAVETGVSASRDDGAAMAAALHRLAKLRATIYRDWSDGPSSLVAYANEDAAVRQPHPQARAYPLHEPDLAFALDPTFTVDGPKPLDLRGRFDCLEEMPPAAAVDEVDHVELGAGSGAPVAYLLDLVRQLPEAQPSLTQAKTPESAIDSNDASVLGVGAVAGLAIWAVGEPKDEVIDASAVEAPRRDEPADDILAVGAFGWIDAPTLDTPAVESRAVAAHAANDPVDEVLAVGAVAACLALDAPVIVDSAPAAMPQVIETADIEDVTAYGAAANIADLVALTPPAEIFTPPPVIDLEVVALDDFLADACEALYAAALDPTELYAWGASDLPGDSDVAALLASCEAALWDLPRIIPCSEVFAFNPNHEIAVQITRALRVRADTLRARAFTDHVNFGALRTLDAHMPWFPSVEAPAEEGDDTVDADTQLATWGMSDLSTIITAPDRPLPILSEAELDALLATPAARDSHELEDDWQENPVWQETFWHDVDAYLQAVESDAYSADAPVDAPEAETASDIEIRDDSSGHNAMHFWLPGDEADLAITGEGADLFLIGGGDAGVVLVEDGAMHTMRTGRGTRMDEVVVSWSTDSWSDIDSMTWTRVATFSGVSQLRVEQTVAHDRMVVVAGALYGCTLDAAQVRLVEATEHGPREFPVRRIGNPNGSDWSFTTPDTGHPADEETRLFV